MILYTMGFTQKSARDFFEPIKDNRIGLLIDVRLNNQSQLAGFTKGKDLEYFLWKIAGCRYAHELLFAPTKELLDDYKKKKIDWNAYTVIFNDLIEKRDMTGHFEKKYLQEENALLLCSEPLPDMCHRRLVAEAMQKKFGIEIKHL